MSKLAILSACRRAFSLSLNCLLARRCAAAATLSSSCTPRRNRVTAPMDPVRSLPFGQRKHRISAIQPDSAQLRDGCPHPLRRGNSNTGGYFFFGPSCTVRAIHHCPRQPCDRFKFHTRVHMQKCSYCGKRTFRQIVRADHSRRHIFFQRCFMVVCQVPPPILRGNRPLSLLRIPEFLPRTT